MKDHVMTLTVNKGDQCSDARWWFGWRSGFQEATAELAKMTRDFRHVMAQCETGLLGKFNSPPACATKLCSVKFGAPC